MDICGGLSLYCDNVYFVGNKVGFIIYLLHMVSLLLCMLTTEMLSIGDRTSLFLSVARISNVSFL